MKGKKITGLIVATITPVNRNGDFDPGLMQSMIDILLEKGCEGVFGIGSTGNFPLFSTEERKVAAEAHVKAVKGRVPVCIHIGSDTETQTLELARHAGEIGVDSFAAVPPYYYKYDAAALTAYFSRVAAINPDLPFYVYNIPMYAANDVTPAILKSMKDVIPNLAGVKDTTQDFTRFIDYVDVMGTDFGNIMGSDGMCVAAHVMGGAGGICAMASHNPELMAAIFRLVRAGEIEEARRLQFLASRLRLLFMKLPFFTPRVTIMRRRGIVDAWPRNPMRNLSAEQETLLFDTMSTLEDEFNFPLLSKV
ncbi:dihydrodipicolinate synthase family protein [Desulfovibrio sp. OttesenSCG-928-I05]|nr:dihydrodipicolinate synthase family protein [Desulfovibrio sp. OttesenSCG-928-I05]